jgi:hypothetical protein
MRKLAENMWFFVLVLLVVSMGLSTAVFLLYMRSHTF